MNDQMKEALRVALAEDRAWRERRKQALKALNEHPPLIDLSDLVPGR